MGGTLGDCLTCFVWKHVEFLLAKVIYRCFFLFRVNFFFVGGGDHMRYRCWIDPGHL